MELVGKEEGRKRREELETVWLGRNEETVGMVSLGWAYGLFYFSGVGIGKAGQKSWAVQYRTDQAYTVSDMVGPGSFPLTLF